VLLIPVGESPYAELLTDLQRSLDEQDSISLSGRVGDQVMMGCVGCIVPHGSYSADRVADTLEILFEAGSRPQVHGYVEKEYRLGVLSCCWQGSAPLPTRDPDEQAPSPPEHVANGWFVWEYIGEPDNMVWYKWRDCWGCSDEFGVEASAEIVAVMDDLSGWSYRGTEDPYSIDNPATYFVLDRD
jgi:hypothetical protein